MIQVLFLTKKKVVVGVSPMMKVIQVPIVVDQKDHIPSKILKIHQVLLMMNLEKVLIVMNLVASQVPVTVIISGSIEIKDQALEKNKLIPTVLNRRTNTLLKIALAQVLMTILNGTIHILQHILVGT